MLRGHTLAFSNSIEHLSSPAEKRSKTEDSKQIKKKKKRRRRQKHLYCKKSTKYEKYSLYERHFLELTAIVEPFFPIPPDSKTLQNSRNT